MITTSLESLEGRLVAQRKLLGMIVAELARSGQGEGLLEFLRERQVLHDGQEDPGAVPAEALDFALATADEFRLIAEAVRQARRAGAPSEGEPGAS